MVIGNVSENTVFLPSPQGALATHLQTSRQVIRTVVIVPSLVEERKACHLALTETGRLLAAQGAAVLRFDPCGCGDATAAFATCSVADWVEDLRTAAHTLRQMHPQVPLIWLGVRAGALLALQAAAAADDSTRPAALVLWEPVTGPDFIRQLLQRRLVNEMVAYGQARLGRRAIEERLAQGETVDFDGFAMSGRLYRDLQGLQPCAWKGPGVILTTGPDARTADTCHGLAPNTTRLSLRLPPFWNTVGQVDTRALTDATAAWIEKQRSAVGGQTPETQSNSPALASATPDGAERMVAIHGAHGTVRGVLHLPATAARRGRVLFLHGWSGDRTGPHRMFVHAARMLAAQGYTCLRFDFRGRGDSDGAACEATIASMTADARAAVAWLRAEAPQGGPLVLQAICSGCKVAINTASAETDVARLALWSAESMGSLRSGATGSRRLLATLRTYARKLLRPETWRKLLRGQVRAGMVSKALVPAEVRSPEEARAGRFSSDRTIGEYARDIWHVSPCEVTARESQ